MDRNRNMNRQEAEFDRIGYVNNRGASKYWGVSKIPKSSRWKVAMFTGRPDKLQSNQYAFPNFEISEKEAAWIAAYFYENPNYTLPVVIAGRKHGFEYRISSDNRISRYFVEELSACVQMVKGPASTNLNLDPKPKPKNINLQKVDDRTLSEREAELVSELYEMIASSEPKSDKFYDILAMVAEARIAV